MFIYFPKNNNNNDGGLTVQLYSGAQKYSKILIEALFVQRSFDLKIEISIVCGATFGRVKSEKTPVKNSAASAGLQSTTRKKLVTLRRYYRTKTMSRIRNDPSVDFDDSSLNRHRIILDKKSQCHCSTSHFTQNVCYSSSIVMTVWNLF